MFIYIVVFSILLLTSTLDITKPREKNISLQIFWFLITILVLFKGLRWDTGTDFPQYYSVFENAQWTNIFSFRRYGVDSTLMEPGYVFLNVLVRTIVPSYTAFLLITNAAILYVYGKMIVRYIPQYKFTALALLTIATILFPVRQTLAVAAYCYSIRYILSKDFRKFFLMVIVCFSIHRSAIMLVVTYPLLQTEFKLKRSIAIYVGLIFAGELMYSFFDILKNSPINALMGNILNTYDATNENMQAFDEENSSSSRTLTYISSIVQLSLYYYGYSKMKSILEDKKFFNIILNMYFFMLCLTVITFIPGFGSMNRLPAYFEFAYPIIVTLTVSYFCKCRRNSLLGLLLFFCVFYIKFKASTLSSPQSLYYDAFVPYKSFLQSDEPMRQGIWLH